MKRNVLVTVIKYAYVWILVAISLYPLLYMLILSLKSNDEFLSSPNGFMVKELYLKNYLDAWNMGNFNVLGINTIYMTAATIFLCIIFGATAGYAIEKLCGKDGAIYYNYFIIGIIIPIQVIMIPLFKLLKSIHLINNVIGIILLYTALNLSFSIFIFTGFFKTVPNQMIEAARIDGCSYFKSFWVIVFPLCKTITATISIFVGMSVWKDFTVPLIYITNPDLKTLSIGLLSFRNQYMTNWPALSAAMIIQTLPIIILFLAMQKYFIKGITAGAVKG
ncbi:MAG TPA: carbohydrate ABC transporter permease [Cytophagaceae bacterium]